MARKLLSPRGYVTTGANATSVTPEQLATNSRELKTGVTVKASPGNGADIVYVGTTPQLSASNGYPLAAGDEVDVPVDSESKVWVVASANTPTVHWISN